jgi:hypothetical protein
MTRDPSADGLAVAFCAIAPVAECARWAPPCEVVVGEGFALPRERSALPYFGKVRKLDNNFSGEYVLIIPDFSIHPRRAVMTP